MLIGVQENCFDIVTRTDFFTLGSIGGMDSNYPRFMNLDLFTRSKK